MLYTSLGKFLLVPSSINSGAVYGAVQLGFFHSNFQLIQNCCLGVQKLTEIEIGLPKIAKFYNIFTSFTTPYENVCCFDIAVNNSCS